MVIIAKIYRNNGIFAYMRKIILCIILFAFCFSAGAGNPKLKFDKDGNFKVLQLTDLHMNAGNEEDEKTTLKRIRYEVKTEKPDLIAITGDVISNGGVCRPLFQRFLDTLDDLKVPFCFVFGNHDQEQDMTKAEISKMVAACKYSIAVIGKDGILADIRVPVKNHKGNGDGFELYFMDSHTSIQEGSPYEDMQIRYEWMSFDQVSWIRNEFRKSADEHGRIIPSAAFFHIPLPEFLEAWQVRTSEHFTHNNVTGVRGEYGGHSRINSGMFAAMLEGGSTIGVFCGHDHDSDFIVDYMGIALAYGRCCGDGNTYHHLRHGARVIEFHEGQRSFTTWILEDDGSRIYTETFNDGTWD